MAMLSRLQPRPAEAVYSSKLARWGIYGRNGVGKTTFLSTIPDDIPTLVASCDAENVKPLAGKSNILVSKVSEWQDLDDILELGRALEVRAKKSGVTACIAFDTWTRMQAMCLNHMAGFKLVEPGQEAKYILEAPRLPKGYEAWQQIGALMGTWLEYFERLDVHLIFLMQEVDKHPQHEADILVTEPILTPSALGRCFDSLELVGRLYVDLQSGKDILADVDDNAKRAIDPNAKEIRRLLVGHHPRYRTKGDTKQLGYVVEEPTFDKLAATLRKGTD